MKYILKKKIAVFLIRSFNLSRLIKFLYQLTMDLGFEKISQPELLQTMSLVKTNFSNKLRLCRIGSKNDGGYIVVDDFSKSDVMISLGIGNNSDFEYALSSKIDRIVCYDHSVKSLPKTNGNIEFRKLSVKAKPTLDSVTLSSIINSIPVSQDLILKIDIEGWEWEVLNSITKNELLRFRQIIGEFHNFQRGANFQVINKVLTKIVSDFTLVNSHANNWGDYGLIKQIAVPDVIELTFYRTFAKKTTKNITKKHKTGLNSKNNPTALDLEFNFHY